MNTRQTTHRARRRLLALGALAGTAALTLAGCATTSGPGESTAPETSSAEDHDHDHEHSESLESVVLTYDGGIYVLDAETLEVRADIPLEGFNRINPVGDGRYVLVSTEGGFRVLDTGEAHGDHLHDPELTDFTFAATTPGHVVHHADTTVLYDDGTGDITIFPTDSLAEAIEIDNDLPETTTVTSPEAHHGVAIQLEDGTVLSTVGNSESRSGVRLTDTAGTELAVSDECPSVHGEGTLSDETALFGCSDGVLVFSDGAFTKLQSPDEYGRTGNQYISANSPIAVGDYNSDPDSEGYLLSKLVTVDTRSNSLEVLELPAGIEYTWRDVARGPDGEILVLGTDGALHVFDAESRELQESFDVIAAWEGPAQWQDAHPAISVIDGTAFITEPANNSVHAVDIETGEILASASLDAAPNEINTIAAHDH
ncbi:zinc metallochaperone AztD [Humidisolicoccus flavus]|uniref:zinc metallochaperone AztD n=1 Tax=Humidisolicoccus flavus TaxID=3111414 RepID=UPI00324A464D